MNGRALFLLLLSSIVAIGCSNDDKLLSSYDLRGNTMGTTYHVTLVAPPADTDLEQLQTGIQGKLEHIENIASTYRSDSELSLFNANPSTEWVSVLPEFCDMIAAAQNVSETTGGAFDITVGPLVNLWGFGPPQSEQELPTDEEVAAAQLKVGNLKLQTDCEQSLLRKSAADVYVDLSGWAKGYAVDEIATLLDAGQLTNYLVEIGGELRVRGHNAEQRKFAIAVEKPLQNNGMEYSVVRLSDVAIATSGDYRNFYEHDGQRYSHTIDPRTGRPVTHDLTGVTVITESTAYADAMATALLVLGPEDGHALAEQLDLASYFLVRTDHGIEELTTSQFAQLRQQ
jgi:thiamine biosynthesis lipoprotein